MLLDLSIRTGKIPTFRATENIRNRNIYLILIRASIVSSASSIRELERPVVAEVLAAVGGG